MNPFLHGFTAVKLIEYIQRLQASVADKKAPRKKRLKARDDLLNAQDALRVILSRLVTKPQNAGVWREQAGLQVKITATKMHGYLKSLSVPQEPSAVLVEFNDGAHSYYPEELEIVLPLEMWKIPLC